MNTKLNLLSNATKTKSLLAAVTIVAGLQGSLLWQFNEVANSDAQNVRLAARAPTPAIGSVPAQASLTQTYRLTLEPVTIVVRRDAKVSEVKVASVKKQAASSVADRATNAM